MDFIHHGWDVTPSVGVNWHQMNVDGYDVTPSVGDYWHQTTVD
jgi:hypothetical protein